MAKNKGEKPKLNTATFKRIKNGLYRLTDTGPLFVTNAFNQKEALEYLQQCNYDISYLEE